MRELINAGYGYSVPIIEDMIPDDEFCTFIQYVHEHSTPKQLQIFYKVAVNFEFFIYARQCDRMYMYNTIMKLSQHSDNVIATFIAICRRGLEIFNLTNPIGIFRVLDERYIKVATVWNDAINKYQRLNIITPELYYIWLHISKY